MGSAENGTSRNQTKKRPMDEEIRKKDKGAPKKFWNHVKTPGSKNGAPQKFSLVDEDKHLEGQQALVHIHQVIIDMFRQMKYAISSEMAIAPQKPTEREINLINLDWKGAGEKVPARTAVGPDGIPMQLINLLGPKSKAILIRALENVIQDKQIP